MGRKTLRRRRTLLIVLVLAASLPVIPAAAAQEDGSRDNTATDAAAAAEPTEILVRNRGGLRPLSDDSSDWVAVEPEAGETTEEAFDRLSLALGDANVAYNLTYHLHGNPNDEFFWAQWNFGAVDVVSAWDHTMGAGATVAVIDTGVGLGGEDLTCHAFVAPYNSFTGTPGLGAVTDVDGHGTHVTGTVAQCTDNFVGVAGVAPDVSVMPVKATNDATGLATSLSLAAGIDWAVANGADVINASLGRDCAATWPTCSDAVVNDAIDAADAAGVVVVVSAGNDGTGFVATPANHPKAIAVGATTISNSRASYSSYGSALDFMAPGGSSGAGILQETLNGGWGYYYYTGTSSAAPHVAAAAALMVAVRPSITPDQVKSVLRGTATDLGPAGWDQQHGDGLIQAGAAVAEAANPSNPCPPGPDCDAFYTINTGGQWGLWDEVSLFSGISNFYYGNPGDVGFSGDWNCNGVATPGLYRQSDGFVYLRNSNTQGVADITFFFGNPGDVPVAGDFNNDGCDTVSLYRPSQGKFFVINELGEDGGGLGAAETSYFFGNPGDKPFAGDYDGDGIDTFGLHRESTGFVYFRNSHTQGNADAQFIYGNPGDILFAGDWDGDGDDTVAVYRPGNGTLYVKLTNTAGNADHEMLVGYYPQLANASAT